MLLLRKAADPQPGGWSLAKLTTSGGYFQNMNFPSFRRGANGRENDIPLDSKRAIW